MLGLLQELTKLDSLEGMTASFQVPDVMIAQRAKDIAFANEGDLTTYDEDTCLEQVRAVEHTGESRKRVTFLNRRALQEAKDMFGWRKVDPAVYPIDMRPMTTASYGPQCEIWRLELQPPIARRAASSNDPSGSAVHMTASFQIPEETIGENAD